MTPAALSLIMTTYSGAQRAKGLALWGAVGGLGIAAGVVVGGALTTWAGWQSIFWVNVPIGVRRPRAVGQGAAQARSAVRPALASFDLAGAATAVGGLAALMFALAGAPSHGWTSARTIVALVVSAVLLSGVHPSSSAASAQPLVHPHTWSISSLVSGTVVMLGVTGVLVAAVFLGSIFVQTVLGYSALEAGLAFLPLAAALVVGTHVAAHVERARHGPDRRRRSASSSPPSARSCSPGSRPATPTPPACSRAWSSSASAPAWSSSRSRPRR